MDQEQPFYLFFGLIGLVLGGVLVWFLMADHPFENRGSPPGPVDDLEAGLLAGEMTRRGQPIDEETVAQVLALHSAYLEGRYADELERTRETRLDAGPAPVPPNRQP